MSLGRLGTPSRRRGQPPIGDINMTPLIDVMLVLLVIFIVTAPLLGSALRLDLPKTEALPPATSPLAPLRLAIDADGRWYADDEPLPRERIEALAREAAARDPATEVHLRADRRVPYGEVAEMIALVQRAGLARIGFVTETAPSR